MQYLDKRRSHASAKIILNFFNLIPFGRLGIGVKH